MLYANALHQAEAHLTGKRGAGCMEWFWHYTVKWKICPGCKKVWLDCCRRDGNCLRDNSIGESWSLRERPKGWYCTLRGVGSWNWVCFHRIKRNGSCTSQVRKRTLPLITTIAVFLIQNTSCAKIRCQMKKDYLLWRFFIWSIEKPLHL